MTATRQPELIAQITRKSDGKQILVVKRGGEPVHVSEVIPEVLESIVPPRPAA